MNEYDHLIQLQLASERRSRRYTFGILLAWLLVVGVLIFGSGCADSHYPEISQADPVARRALPTPCDAGEGAACWAAHRLNVTARAHGAVLGCAPSFVLYSDTLSAEDRSPVDLDWFADELVRLLMADTCEELAQGPDLVLL